MLNFVLVEGRVTKDPVLRKTALGQNVCNVVLAVSDPRVDEEDTRNCLFITVTCWDWLAEFAAAEFKKGKLMIVVGRLIRDRWESAGGVQMRETKICAREIHHVGNRREDEAEARWWIEECGAIEVGCTMEAETAADAAGMI